ncbi:MAG TPA: DinB family protein [Bryobacteraceae bacterium]|nr:DinB family protein [Bryobacteraceae bacterium]HOQ44469.1 DinB family protein [Bryobacteraceae bacterium]HPQ15476.1 DinB family protein [Bryobacteraceae bacterium]HPU70788.1 DinB family protein [Bryobacteraceae bacterium]
MSEIQELLERFRRGAELVATAMTGAAGPELDFVPEPGKWSVRQIVAHLADSEIVAADRFRRIIAEENPTLISYDQDAWARNLNYARRRTSDSLETFRRLRAENWELLKDLPESAFERKATHSERGTITLLDLLKIYAAHPEAHARQLMEVRNRYKEAKKQHA